jgi:hypothetical protein
MYATAGMHLFIISRAFGALSRWSKSAPSYAPPEPVAIHEERAVHHLHYRQGGIDLLRDLKQEVL